MLSQQLEAKEDARSKYIEEAIQTLVKRKGYSEIRAKSEGYEEPARLTSVDKDIDFIPDITARRRGRKCYFDVAIKPDKKEVRRHIVSKWKLLQTLSTLKNGKFILIAPRGHFAFTQRMCNRHNIDAEIVKL